ncbi:MAG: RNA polymerase sigma factor [Tissierellia bacterium]|nr:RNA polymerase sigma factor [Tissierellia bacterium]
MDFENIYELYFRDIYLYLKSFTKDATTAEELTQETFYKALNSIHTFDGSKDIRAWLFTIARNTYFSTYRKRKNISLQENFNHFEDKRVKIVEHLSQKEEAFEIHRFLHDMNEPYKEVFTLRVFGELSFEKIGELFGKSSGWARVTYHRGKKKILEYMEEKNNEI